MDTPTELRKQLLRCVAHLEPERMTGEQAAAAVSEFSTIEKAAATARMFAAVRVAQTDAWRGKGHASAADWLAAEAGITVRQAAAQLGTARKADRLPKTKERMRKGKLSPTQAGAVTDGATADPEAEESLLDAADRGTTADLQDRAAKAKAAATDAATRERRIRSERTLRTRTDAEGAFCLWLRGPSADGAGSSRCSSPSRSTPSATAAPMARATRTRTAATTPSSPCSPGSKHKPTRSHPSPPSAPRTHLVPPRRQHLPRPPPPHRRRLGTPAPHAPHPRDPHPRRPRRHRQRHQRHLRRRQRRPTPVHPLPRRPTDRLVDPLARHPVNHPVSRRGGGHRTRCPIASRAGTT
jgi:hypothetical protein